MTNPALAQSGQQALANPGAPASPLKRLLSLDVVRGITIAFMIMVNNNGGSGSWHFMNHAQWNGLTPTDLVFPTFVFVVGISIVFGFESRLARGATRSQLAWHTAQRTGILILFGIIVNNFPFFELRHMRFYGVLQRIAVCYFVVCLLYLWDRRASTKVLALAVALLGYWALLWWVPIPGAGLPGRDVPFLDQRQNIVSYVDRVLMPHHLYLDWDGPDPHNTRDPEGLLSDLPAIGTALLGVLAGLWLRSARSLRDKFGGLAIAAAACLAAGYLWSTVYPLNKNMWTSSYVLVAAGFSLVLLTLCFWIIDVRGWRSGWTWPWLIFGSNAIAAYMFSELVPGILNNIAVSDGPGRRANLAAWIFEHCFAHISNPHWAAFAWSISFTAFCFIPVWILYRRKIFLKV